MKVKIEIDTRTFVRFWLVVIGFALVALTIYSARTALLIIGLAFFFAIALSPPVNRLARILPSKSRVLSTALSYSVVVLILGIIVFLVIPPVIEQTVKFAQNIPDIINSNSQQASSINTFIDHYNLRSEVDKIIITIKDSATQFASGIGSVLITSIGSVLSIITAFILVLVLTFLMLVEGPVWLDRLWRVYGDKAKMEHHRLLSGRMYKVVTSYVTGQLSVSAIAGCISGLSVFILSLIFDVPTSLAIPAAATVFILSLIPMFGAMIGAIFVGLFLALNNITAAIIFLIFFILYQQLEANYISPKIQSKRIDLSVLTILLSVTIGIYLFGIVGGIISIPIASCIKIIAEDHSLKLKK